MQRSIKVLVIDGYPIVRWALREALSSQANICVVGEVSSFREVNSIIKLRKPDVVISELQSADGDALQDWMGSFVENSVKILAFTECESWDCLESFLNAGGTGYASKRASLDELVVAVNAVAGGLRWISPNMRSLSRRPKAEQPSAQGIALTPRESEIVSLITQGLTSRQIADQLCVSIKTVESHRYRIFKKLNVKHCAQLANYALKNGI